MEKNFYLQDHRFFLMFSLHEAATPSLLLPLPLVVSPSPVVILLLVAVELGVASSIQTFLNLKLETQTKLIVHNPKANQKTIPLNFPFSPPPFPIVFIKVVPNKIGPTT
jgi:hypothetical protein